MEDLPLDLVLEEELLFLPSLREELAEERLLSELWRRRLLLPPDLRLLDFRFTEVPPLSSLPSRSLSLEGLLVSVVSLDGMIP